jgi:hypothetical protein
MKRVLMTGNRQLATALVREAMMMTAAPEMSFDDIQSRIYAALRLKFGVDSAVYCVDTFPTYVIIRQADGALYRLDYAWGDRDGDGQTDDIIFSGDPQEVEEAYIPVSQAATFIAEEAGSKPDPWKFPVQIMKPGIAHGEIVQDGKRIPLPHNFGPGVVAEVAQAANTARFGRRHPASGLGEDDPERTAGWFDHGRVVGDCATADLNLFKSETAMQARLNAAREAGQLGQFGLSILGIFAFRAAKIEGRDALDAVKLVKLASIDLCAEPGAGGGFLEAMRVAASRATFSQISDLQSKAVKQSSATGGLNEGGARSASPHGGTAMKERILKAIEALRKSNAARATELTTQLTAAAEDAGKQSEVLALVAEALTGVVSIGAAAAQTAGEDVVAQAKEALKQAQRIQADNRLETKLATSKLPVPALAIIRESAKEAFDDGRLWDDAKVDAKIASVRESFAAFTTARVHSGIEVGRDSEEKLQLAMNKMLGVREAMADATVHAFRGLKDAYVTLTGDRNLAFGVGGHGGFLAKEATVVTGDFPNILLNSMTKKLLQDYREPQYAWVDNLVSVVDINDFKSQDRVRMGYLADLATVAEDGPYTDFVVPTDEKISYVATKRGNVLPISRETILNDDLNKIAQFPARISRAARRTYAKFVLGFFVNSPNFDADATAWFHANHANLGAAALTIDELVLREIALRTQTEKDSAEPLDLTLDWIMVPVQLAAQAFRINSAQFVNPGVGIQVPNPFWQRFGANGERIYQSALLVDANDWYYGTSPANAPFLEVGFVQGQREPQMFLQNDPTVGAVFTNDRITYKVRHEYGGDIMDYRGVGKNVVA